MIEQPNTFGARTVWVPLDVYLPSPAAVTVAVRVHPAVDGVMWPTYPGHTLVVRVPVGTRPYDAIREELFNRYPSGPFAAISESGMVRNHEGTIVAGIVTVVPTTR